MSDTVKVKVPRRVDGLTPREQIIRAKRRLIFAGQQFDKAEAFLMQRKDELQALIDEHGDLA